MWRRIELHNHSVESDGQLQAEELAAFMEKEGTAFALTDHNTISGWRKLAGRQDVIYGYELTSYFGHLLCQNISGYIPWEDIQAGNADPLLRRVHEAGGLAGPAHPCSAPFPLSNGMAWEMKIHDFGLVDFVEIINAGHELEPDNKNSILWWEKLVFAGWPIAPVAGLDLHSPQSLEGLFTTYIEVENQDLPLAEQLNRAIKKCRTCVTRGPVLDWKKTKEGIEVTLLPGKEKAAGQLVCQLRTAAGTMEEYLTAAEASGRPPAAIYAEQQPETIYLEQPVTEGCCRFLWENMPEGCRVGTLMLFENSCTCCACYAWENLVAVTGPVHMAGAIDAVGTIEEAEPANMAGGKGGCCGESI